MVPGNAKWIAIAALALLAGCVAKGNRNLTLQMDDRLVSIAMVSDAGETNGAFTCSFSDVDNAAQLWIDVARLESKRADLRDFGDSWLLNGRKIPRRLQLRIDGQSFASHDVNLYRKEDGRVMLQGALTVDGALADAIKSAGFMEIVAGDTALSVVTAGNTGRLARISSSCHLLEKASLVARNYAR